MTTDQKTPGQVLYEALVELRENLVSIDIGFRAASPDLTSRWIRAEIQMLDAIIAHDRANQPAASGAWQPIETAPTDGSYFLASNKHGVWVAYWQQFAISGYRFDTPWRSAMLNHWHIKPEANQYKRPTHWCQLPAAPEAPKP